MKNKKNPSTAGKKSVGKKGAVVPTCLGLLLLAFAVVSFTGKTFVGAFLTYSFAFLFGSFFPAVLILLLIAGIVLVVRKRLRVRGHLLMKIGFLGMAICALALCGYPLLNTFGSFSLTDFSGIYVDRMSAFSDSLTHVADYGAFVTLGGGYLGTGLLALLSSFLTVEGATVIFSLLLCVFFLLFAFEPVRRLFGYLRRRSSAKVEYRSPFQGDDEEDMPKIRSEDRKTVDLDPELTRPFSSSWYEDKPAPAFEDVQPEKDPETLLADRSKEEENLLLGFVPKSRGTTKARSEEHADRKPSFLSDPYMAMSEEKPVVHRDFLSAPAKNAAAIRSAEQESEPEEKAEPAFVPEPEPAFRPESEKTEIVPARLKTVVAPTPVVQNEETLPEEGEPEPEPAPVEATEENEPAETAEEEPAVIQPEMASFEAERTTKPEEETVQPKIVAKPIDESLERQASIRAKAFHESSKIESTTFEVLQDDGLSEPEAPALEEKPEPAANPLVAQAQSLSTKKVIESTTHEFMVDGVHPAKEEDLPSEENSQAILEQRYFELRRKKIEEEQEKKLKEEEERKAKIYKYVSPTGRKYGYALPDDSLLDERDDSDKLIENNQSAQDKAKIINRVFDDFKIQAKAISFTIGASVTRFNIQMEPGVRSEKINSVLNELQIALNGDKSVRIETVVEGRTTSGIEIGNAKPMAVSFKEAFQEVEKHPESNLLLPIGKDISGKIVTFPLDEMPHLLVAGTTGSGKSVLVHSFIMTLIMRNYPSQLKLMLIDPKQVEFAKYNLESHLYCPVISDSNSAIVALQKLCDEMDRRYSVLRQWECVKMSEYRKKRQGREDVMEEIPDVVCVIDEFADLMQTGGSEVAETVQRISQKARAAGIYLIIATQRPSKDVIPMVIKSNIACRIGLSCSTAVDSRVILDENGAETLLGKGDLLFKCPGKKSLIRAQSPYISNEDMDRILSYVKANAGDPNYDPEFLELDVPSEEPTNGKMEGEGDLYEDVKDFVMKTGIVSKSALIRNFSLSYPKADQFIARMRKEGIVQAIQGGKNIVVQRRPMEE